jgi:hypothetical protein
MKVSKNKPVLKKAQEKVDKNHYLFKLAGPVAESKVLIFLSTIADNTL